MNEAMKSFVEFTAAAVLIYLFTKEPLIVAFEKVLFHNIRVAVVRCHKRLRPFMAWLNDESISEQIEADYKPPKAFLLDDWRSFGLRNKKKTDKRRKQNV